MSNTLVSNTHVSQILRDAIDVVETKGWTQGALVNSEEKVCTLGAIDVATRMALLTNPDHAPWYIISDTAKAWVEEALNDHFQSSAQTIAGHNDRPGTTKEDILLGLKHALHRAEEGE